MTTMVNDVRFQAGPNESTLYVPEGAGCSPGILLLHGSEGGHSGWSSFDALALAMQGFATYPLNYSKGGNLWHAGDIHDVDLEQTVEALEWLRRHPCVNGKAGVYGVSRGAEQALLVTSLLARDDPAKLPDAVAVHSPSDTICGAFISGQFHPNEEETWDPSKRAWRWRGSTEAFLPTMPIEIERYSGPVLLSHGEADKTWTVECTRRLETRLRAAGRNPEVHYYADEGHTLKPETQKIALDRLLSFFQRHL
jgi:dipeptidyl aminopeptidase/acylaminoacyl peptidase